MSAWQIAKDALSMVASLSIIVALFSYFHHKKASNRQHERASREKAASALHDFFKALTVRSAAAVKLVKELSDKNIERLEQGEEFTVRHEHRDLLVASLPDHLTRGQVAGDGDVKLSRNQSYQLRWEIISQLNSCEVLAQYWSIGVADRDMIEEEVRFLRHEKPNENIVTACRKLAPREGFPALHRLICRLEATRPVEGPPRKPV